MGLAFLTAFIFLLIYILVKPRIFNGHTSKNYGYAFWCAFILFFALRIVLAAATQGFPSDMACWRSWGEHLNETGTAHFYSSGYFCDYPPFYIYVLGIINRASGIFGISSYGIDFLNKLPAVLCDMLLMAVLYREVSARSCSRDGFIISCFFGLCPVFLYDSAVWGQIESVLLFFLCTAFLLLYSKQYIPSVLLYVTAVLIKPQGLLLAPVFILEILCTKNLRTILLSALSGLLLFILLSVPFSPAWQSFSGFWAFFNALNPLWLIEKYLTTMSSYPYFSVNAFNFYTLLGLNWVSLENSHAVLLSVVNALVITASVTGAVLIFFKVKSSASRLFLSAYFILGFLYTFAFKMHERYIILPVFFLMLEYIFSKNKRILGLFTGFSITGFLNLVYILSLARAGESVPDCYPLTALISLAEVTLFILSLYIIYTEYISEKKHRRILPGLNPHLASVLRGSDERGLSPAENDSFCRIDAVLLSAIMLVYSVIAFVNLGDIKAPQTYYAAETGDIFVITLKEPELISEIDYYCGIGDTDGNSGIIFSYSEDGDSWIELPEPCCCLKSVFKWEVQYIEPIKAKYLKGVPVSADYTLYEIGLRNTGGALAKIESVTGSLSSDYAMMADEQDCVTNAPSYMNGTYFDEIYHPRTAYEHLHLMPYYETTHPPLGKLIMAAGIAVFGMTPFGWRFTGTLTGVLMLPVFYLLLKKMFRRTRYAVIGTLLFAFDFMHFSLTRIGTIDSYPVFFIICMYYFLYMFYKSAVSLAGGWDIPYSRLLKYLALSGLSMGLGCASKWTAVYASAGLAAEFFVIMLRIYRTAKAGTAFRFRRFFIKTCLWCLLFFIAVPAVIYTLSYVPISMTEGYGNVFTAMLNNQKYMLTYHSTLTGTHPYSSPWYSWPFVYKPMWAYQAPEASVNTGQIGCISIFQNPFLSWLGIASVLYSAAAGFKKRDKNVLFLMLGLAFQYLPWAFVSRYALQYHFFASMPFLICLVIYAMKDIEKRLPSFGYISVSVTAVCLVMFVCFYPVISGTPVSRFWAETMLTWFDSWVFFL